MGFPSPTGLVAKLNNAFEMTAAKEVETNNSIQLMLDILLKEMMSGIAKERPKDFM